MSICCVIYFSSQRYQGHSGMYNGVIINMERGDWECITRDLRVQKLVS